MKSLRAILSVGWKKRVISRSIDETTSLAKVIAGKLVPGSILALYGDLGAGKTTFTKGVISTLTGIPVDDITSPTFTYMNLYSTKNQEIVCHFDLYRLKSADDFLLAGFEEYLGKPYITLIEWPVRIESLLSLPHEKITISSIDEETREFIWG